jgi:hypothetical protein
MTDFTFVSRLKYGMNCLLHANAGDDSKAYWDGAVRHGYNSGQGDLGFGNTDWAVMINAPGASVA